jgi:hypothetical protein
MPTTKVKSWAVLLLTWPIMASGLHAQTATRIEFSPAAPTSDDAITFDLSGTWRDGCVPQSPAVSVQGNSIVIKTSNPNPICTQAATPWSLAGTIGRLVGGDFQVIVTYESPASTLEIGRRTLSVSGLLPRAAVDFAVDESGSASKSTTDNPGPLQIGYARFAAANGPSLFGGAIFSQKKNGIIVSETGVPASMPTQRARVFVEYRHGATIPPAAGNLEIITGIAVANLSSGSAVSTFVLRNLEGRILATGHGVLEPGQHWAKFIDELDVVAPNFELPSDFASATGFGTLEISSDRPVSVLALRQTTTHKQNVLYATTPTADLSIAPARAPVYFPQFADGGGFSSTLILMNTTDFIETGMISLLDDNGLPLDVLTADGMSGSAFPYRILPGGAFRLQTDGYAPVARAGWIAVVPDPDSFTPVGAGIFSYGRDNALLWEAGVPSVAPTTHVRVYVDLANGNNTGVALGNLAPLPSDITLNAHYSDGTVVPGSHIVLHLPGGGHTARFANEWLQGLPSGFAGSVDISSTSPFTALSLRSHINELGDFLMTTFPIADMTQPPPALLAFPQIAVGGGFSTEFFFINAGSTSRGTLAFFDERGAPLAVGR